MPDQPDQPTFQSLAQSLGLVPERAPDTSLEAKLVDIKDPKAFADALIDSLEFRRYVVYGLQPGADVPGFATLLKTIIDRSSWGVTPTKTELTGKDGAPLETVTEVRRVIVQAPAREASFEDEMPEERSARTH